MSIITQENILHENAKCKSSWYFIKVSDDMKTKSFSSRTYLQNLGKNYLEELPY